ncbi:MAG: hypothetical protein JXR52_12685 [Bacteroidales bacterium]|nr:hypothetical protein [Bacteroidales bacterium]
MTEKHSFVFITMILIFMLILFDNCASENGLSKRKVSADTLFFGKSGGFANLAETYALDENGRVYKEVGGELQEMHKIRKAAILEINQKLDSLDIESLELQETGNMTWFIEVRSDTLSNKVTWTGSTDHPGIKELYKILVNTLQKE